MSILIWNNAWEVYGVGIASVETCTVCRPFQHLNRLRANTMRAEDVLW